VYLDEKGQTSCKTCPTGYYQNQNGKTSCTQCNAGQFQNQNGQSSCFTCVYHYGKYQNEKGQSNCKICAAGTRSNTDAKGCTSCTAGQYQNQNGQSSCKTCNAGQFSATGANSCTICSPGTFSATGASVCINCVTYTYQNEEGKVTCKNVLTCELGQYEVTVPTLTTNRVCESCEIGKYQDQRTQSTCKECPVGYSNAVPSSTLCTACEIGKYQNEEEQFSCKVCDVCTVGRGATNGCTSAGGTICTDCTVGKFNNVNDYATDCITCEPGKYQDETTQSSCKNCPSGKWIGSIGDSPVSCTECDICPVGRGTPVKCTGSMNSQCTICTPGKFSDVNDYEHDCSICDVGKYQNQNAQSSCKECQPGKYGTRGLSTFVNYLLFDNALGSCPVPNTQYFDCTITVSNGQYPSEVSWDIADAISSVASGSAGANTNFFIQTSVSRTFDGFALNMHDSYGDGWNGAEAIVTCNSFQIVGATISFVGIFDEGYTKIIDFPKPVSSDNWLKYTHIDSETQCTEAATDYFTKHIQHFNCSIDITEGDFKNELKWSIIDDNGIVHASGVPFNVDDLGYYEGNNNFILKETEYMHFDSYTLYMYDTGDDGWNGAVATVTCNSFQIPTETISFTGTVLPWNEKAVLSPYLWTYPYLSDRSIQTNTVRFGVRNFGDFGMYDEYWDREPSIPIDAPDYPRGCQLLYGQLYFNTNVDSAVRFKYNVRSLCRQEIKPAENIGNPEIEIDYRHVQIPSIVRVEPDRCALCELGKYQNENGTTGCKLCTVGKFNDFKSFAANFERAEYGATVCKSCKTGKYQNEISATDCKPCEIRKYQDEETQSSCKLCTGGRYNDEESATVCLNCLPGTFTEQLGQDICEQCVVGMYQNEYGKTKCKLCKRQHGHQHKICDPIIGPRTEDMVKVTLAPVGVEYKRSFSRYSETNTDCGDLCRKYAQCKSYTESPCTFYSSINCTAIKPSDFFVWAFDGYTCGNGGNDGFAIQTIEDCEEAAADLGFGRNVNSVNSDYFVSGCFTSIYHTVYFNDYQLPTNYNPQHGRKCSDRDTCLCSKKPFFPQPYRIETGTGTCFQVTEYQQPQCKQEKCIEHVETYSPFAQVRNGTCDEHGFSAIVTRNGCTKAAHYFGKNMTNKTHPLHHPPGCWFSGTDAFELNYETTNITECNNNQICICSTNGLKECVFLLQTMNFDVAYHPDFPNFINVTNDPSLKLPMGCSIYNNTPVYSEYNDTNLNNSVHSCMQWNEAELVVTATEYPTNLILNNGVEEITADQIYAGHYTDNTEKTSTTYVTQDGYNVYVERVGQPTLQYDLQTDAKIELLQNMHRLSYVNDAIVRRGWYISNVYGNSYVEQFHNSVTVYRTSDHKHLFPIGTVMRTTDEGPWKHTIRNILNETNQDRCKLMCLENKECTGFAFDENIDSGQHKCKLYDQSHLYGCHTKVKHGWKSWECLRKETDTLVPRQTEFYCNQQSILNPVSRDPQSSGLFVNTGPRIGQLLNINPDTKTDINGGFDICRVVGETMTGTGGNCIDTSIIHSTPCDLLEIFVIAGTLTETQLFRDDTIDNSVQQAPSFTSNNYIFTTSREICQGDTKIQEDHSCLQYAVQSSPPLTYEDYCPIVNSTDVEMYCTVDEAETDRQVTMRSENECRRSRTCRFVCYRNNGKIGFGYQDTNSCGICEALGHENRRMLVQKPPGWLSSQFYCGTHRLPEQFDLTVGELQIQTPIYGPHCPCIVDNSGYTCRCAPTDTNPFKPDILDKNAKDAWGCSGHGSCSNILPKCDCDVGYEWRATGDGFTCRECIGETTRTNLGQPYCVPTENTRRRLIPITCPKDTYKDGDECLLCPFGMVTKGHRYTTLCRHILEPFHHLHRACDSNVTCTRWNHHRCTYIKQEEVNHGGSKRADCVCEHGYMWDNQDFTVDGIFLPPRNLHECQGKCTCKQKA